MQQRSKDWFIKRLGRFTGSTVSKLSGVKGLGDTGKTLAFEKAIEKVFGYDPEWNVETWDMKRGTDTEPEAFELFQQLKALEFIEVKECDFFELGENSGASPDGLVGNDAILEIKCPRPEKFFKIVANGIDAIDKDWIDQMQIEMKSAKRNKAYFFIFLKWNNQRFHHTIEVPFDEVRCDFLLERINEAVKLRDEYVDKLIQEAQFEIKST